jgi:hypothetical protein
VNLKFFFIFLLTKLILLLGSEKLKDLEMKYIDTEYSKIEWLQKKLPNCIIKHTATPQYMTEINDENYKVKENLIVVNKKEIITFKANAVIPKSFSLFYFEIKIVNCGSDNSIAIGLSSRSHSLSGMPGSFFFFSFFFLLFYFFNF